MFKLSILTVVTLLPIAAAAQSAQGLYVSGTTGVNFLDTLQSSQATTRIDTGAGPMGLGAVGWGFGDGLRAEIEGSYRSSDIDGISTRRVNGALLPLTDTSGNAGTSAVMVNVEYDIPVQPLGLSIQPYIGGGVGYGWLDFDNAGGHGFAKFRLPENNTVSEPDLVSFGSGGAFAYQAIVGASLPLSMLPGLDLTVEYRYFGMARADVSVSRVSTTGLVVNGAIPSSHTNNGFEVHDNAIAFGVRYAFGAL
jgi:OOP family OmpA-OmpF porin